MACAETIVIGWGQSLPIDQLTTCEPSEQTVEPERMAECAEAGADERQHTCHDDGRDQTDPAGSAARDSNDSFHDVSQPSVHKARRA